MAHFKLVKQILRYISGIVQHGMRIPASSTLDPYGFFDADWGGCSLSRRSTSGFCTFLGSNCLSWSAKKQFTVARFCAKAEYRSIPSVTAELPWLSFILRDIGIPLTHPPILQCDNMSALHMTINPVFHGRTIHIELDYHFVWEKVVLTTLETRFVFSTKPLADIFTNPSFLDLRVQLGLWLNPRPILRGSDKASTPSQKTPTIPLEFWPSVNLLYLSFQLVIILLLNWFSL